MTKVKRLRDESGEEFYPRTVKGAISDYDAPKITVTNTDPGEGADIGEHEFIAVLGDGKAEYDDIDFADISSKMLYANFGTSNRSVNSQGWTTQWTTTIEQSGLYIFYYSHQLEQGEVNHDFSNRITLTRDDTTTILVKASSGGSTWVAYIQSNCFVVYLCKKGDIIKYEATGGGSGSHSTRYGHGSLVRIW